MTTIRTDFAKLDPYLDGNSFSSDLVPRYARSGKIRYRNDILVEACAGKNLLHIGCCDHVPLIARKWQQHDWLHGQLTTVAGSVLGVDIDQAAVDETRRITGLRNIVAGDITSGEVIDAIAQHPSMAMILTYPIVLPGQQSRYFGNPPHNCALLP